MNTPWTTSVQALDFSRELCWRVSGSRPEEGVILAKEHVCCGLGPLLVSCVWLVTLSRSHCTITEGFATPTWVWPRELHLLPENGSPEMTAHPERAGVETPT